MINKCYQYKSFYTSSVLGILQQTEQLSRHTLHQRPQFWVQNLKKSLRRSESGAFFQILMHDDFQQTNVIELEFLTQALCWEYYSKIKN